MSKLGCAPAVAVLGGGGPAGGLETVLRDADLVSLPLRWSGALSALHEQRWRDGHPRR